ncbi:MAG TPA: FtsX-like permease family protein [Geminicoccaceae bacterium]|nr:FtsX-like permease family protein [Geminicoccaceae bacterium]
MNALAAPLATLGLALRVARREMRGGLGGFAVFLACLAIGVAAIGAVGIIRASVGEAVSRDARALLGGDLTLETANQPLAPGELVALLPAGSRVALATRVNAMVESAAGRYVAVALKAVAPDYPLYGEVLLDPPLPLAEALADRGMVAEAGLLARLGLAVGDRVRLGEAEVELRAVLRREPDRLGGFVGIGPRAIVGEDTLAATRVMQPGALAELSYRVMLPSGIDGTALARELREQNPDAGWRARSVEEVQPRVARFTDRLATYLTLAGLTALLTGGLGVALAVDGYLRSKGEAIATLKCLGATSDQIFLIYLVQIMVLAALGVLLGLALGQLLPLLMYLVPEEALPVTLAYGLHPRPLLLAGTAGLLAALVFAIWPLAMAREVSAAGLFRSLVAPVRRIPRTRYLLLLGAAVAALALLAIGSSAQRRVGLGFVGVALASAVALAFLAQGVLLVVRRLGRRGPPSLRLALANIHRPGSGAASVIIALGAGLAVLTMVALVQASLSGEIRARVSDRAPAVVFLDIQPDQVATFQETIGEIPGGQIVQQAPILRARVVRIGGRPVAEVPIAGNVRWTVARDRGLSYRAEMPEGTELTAGAWWPADHQGPPLVSVEDEVAIGYGVGVGDTLAFNVLGRVIETRIANLRREIDWGSGRLDFVFILSPGVLDAAPHTVIAAVDVPEAAEAGLIETMAQRLPNVTPISIREVVAQVTETMDKIGFAVRIVAAVTLATGVLVLAGAVAAARHRHRYQAVVLKVLGARRIEVLRLFMLEYLGLGLAAAAAGAVLGTIGAWVVLTWALDLGFVPSPAAVLGVAVVALALALAAGAVGLWRALGQSAAAVLRSP